MAPITKSRPLTCHPDLIDPYESFQTEITATWVILEDKNMLLNPQGFQAKKDLLKLLFGPIELLAWLSSPNLDVLHAPQVPLIHMNHSSQKFQPLE